MAHIKIPRGVVQDINFRLRDRKGGTLVDDDDWVDGSTAAQWPIITVRDSGNVDKTSSWDKDIATDPLDPSYIKHPDTTKGIFRRSKGAYTFRVKTDVALTLGDYTLEIAYDTGGKRYLESHTITLVEAGDVDFGDEILTTVSVNDLKAVVQTTLDDNQLTSIITLAAKKAKGKLARYKIDADDFSEIPSGVYDAVVMYALGYVYMRDLGVGRRPSKVREGSKTFEFDLPKATGTADFWESADLSIEEYAISTRRGRAAPVVKRKTWREVFV